MATSTSNSASPESKKTKKAVSKRPAATGRALAAKKAKTAKSVTNLAIATELAPAVAIALLDKTEQSPGDPPPALDVVRVWEVDGGQVSASCRGTSIGLIYATASDGWTVETRSAGPEEIEIKLSRNESETAVRARCVAGVPTLTATEDESHGGDDDG